MSLSCDSASTPLGGVGVKRHRRKGSRRGGESSSYLQQTSVTASGYRIDSRRSTVEVSAPPDSPRGGGCLGCLSAPVSARGRLSTNNNDWIVQASETSLLTSSASVDPLELPQESSYATSSIFEPPRSRSAGPRKPRNACCGCNEVARSKQFEIDPAFLQLDTEGTSTVEDYALSTVIEEEGEATSPPPTFPPNAHELESIQISAEEESSLPGTLLSSAFSSQIQQQPRGGSTIDVEHSTPVMLFPSPPRENPFHDDASQRIRLNNQEAAIAAAQEQAYKSIQAHHEERLKAAQEHARNMAERQRQAQQEERRKMEQQQMMEQQQRQMEQQQQRQMIEQQQQQQWQMIEQQQQRQMEQQQQRQMMEQQQQRQMEQQRQMMEQQQRQMMDQQRQFEHLQMEYQHMNEQQQADALAASMSQSLEVRVGDSSSAIHPDVLRFQQMQEQAQRTLQMAQEKAEEQLKQSQLRVQRHLQHLQENPHPVGEDPTPRHQPLMLPPPGEEMSIASTSEYVPTTTEPVIRAPTATEVYMATTTPEYRVGMSQTTVAHTGTDEAFVAAAGAVHEQLHQQHLQAALNTPVTLTQPKLTPVTAEDSESSSSEENDLMQKIPAPTMITGPVNPQTHTTMVLQNETTVPGASLFEAMPQITYSTPIVQKPQMSTPHVQHMSVPIAQQTTHMSVPITQQQTTHMSVPITQQQTTHMSVPITQQQTTHMSFPITQQTTHMSVPVAQQTTQMSLPVAQQTTQMSVPITQQTTQMSVPITQQTTHMSVPIAQQTTHMSVPIAQETTHMSGQQTTYMQVPQHSTVALQQSPLHVGSKYRSRSTPITPQEVVYQSTPARTTMSTTRFESGSRLRSWSQPAGPYVMDGEQRIISAFTGEQKVVSTQTISNTIVAEQFMGGTLAQRFGAENIGHDEHGEYLIKKVEIPMLEERVTQIMKKEVVENVVERRVPKVEYVERVVEVPQVQVVDKLVEKEEIREVLVHVPVKQVIDRPVEVLRTVKVPQIVPRIETKEVPGEIIEIPKTFIVERPVLVPKYVDKKVPVVIAQSFWPQVVEAEETDARCVVDVECRIINFVTVPSDVFVPLPVQRPMVFDRMELRHREVFLHQVPDEQYNALVKALNPSLNLTNATDLFRFVPISKAAEGRGEFCDLNDQGLGGLPLTSGPGTHIVAPRGNADVVSALPGCGTTIVQPLPAAPVPAEVKMPANWKVVPHAAPPPPKPDESLHNDSTRRAAEVLFPPDAATPINHAPSPLAPPRTQPIHFRDMSSASEAASNMKTYDMLLHSSQVMKIMPTGLHQHALPNELILQHHLRSGSSGLSSADFSSQTLDTVLKQTRRGRPIESKTVVASNEETQSAVVPTAQTRLDNLVSWARELEKESRHNERKRRGGRKKHAFEPTQSATVGGPIWKVAKKSETRAFAARRVA